MNLSTVSRSEPAPGQSLLDTITPFVQSGFAVHWLVPNEKRPIGKDWSKKPVWTEDQLAKSFRPGMNVGFRPGEPSRVCGGFLHVLDLDVRRAELAEEARAALRKAVPDFENLPTVQSGSGGPSLHLYFLSPSPLSTVKLAHSAGSFIDGEGKKHWDWELEVLGTGRNVVLPPSIHPQTGRQYRWLRPFDFEMLQMGVGPFITSAQISAWGAVTNPAAANDEDDDDEDLTEYLRVQPLGLTAAEIDATLATLPHGPWCEDRDGWLKVGLALHHEFEGADAGLARWVTFSAQCPEKFDAKVCERHWRDFKGARSRPMTFRTLIDASKKAKVTEGARLTFLRPDECAASPSRSYVIKGLVAAGDVSSLFGSPGAGKSLLSPYLGYMVAQGSPAAGLRTRQGPVFYVAAEDPQGMLSRVSALQSVHGAAPDFYLVVGVSDLLTEGSPDLAALVAEIDSRRPALIVVDTLAMAFPGLEENSAEGMGRVVAVARAMTSTGAAVLLVHHDTKAEGATPRGHSLLNGALDAALHLKTKGEDGIVRGRLTKNRNGPCNLDIAFRIATVDRGTDEDGDAQLVPYADVLAAAGMPPPRPKLTQPQSAALDVLRRLEAASTDLDSAGRAVVDVEAWRRACIDGRLVSASDDPESRRKAMFRALKGLIQAGRVIVQGDWVRTDDASDGFDVSDGFDDFEESDP